MHTVQPKRYYDGIFSDSHHWDQFEHRARDVFICVPPKSGTTWMQAICGLLIFGDPDAQIAYPEISPWIEFKLSSKTIDTRIALLRDQTHQRFIKSHSPLDGVPYFDDCTYIVGHRHPLDVHFSMWNHVQNMHIDLLDHLYTDDVDHTLNAFLSNGIEGEGFDQPSLAFLAHHLRTVRALSDLPNVHLFHYQTTLNDLRGQMARVADAIGVTHPPALFDTLVAKARFKSMKANAHLTAPGGKSGLFKDPSAFFKTGRSGNWAGKLSSEQIERYQTRISELLDQDEIRYIETGLF
jgi:aryl sulfotransferase